MPLLLGISLEVREEVLMNKTKIVELQYYK